MGKPEEALGQVGGGVFNWVRLTNAGLVNNKVYARSSKSTTLTIGVLDKPRYV